MKLIPKAKPIKIRISSGGKEHSTLQSLLECFRVGDVRPLLENGVMLKWLNQIGESKLYVKIRSMSEGRTGTGKWSDSDVLSLFFDSSDKLVVYAEHAYLRSESGALDLLHEAAEMANPSALYRLGCIYYFAHNSGVVTDVEKAEEYFKDAAELNHPLARLAYGFILCGRGLYSKAFELIKNTLDCLSEKDCRMQDDLQVIARANYSLAEIYWDGKKGVPNSSAKAIDLFSKSAELGYPRAYTRLCIIYWKNHETDKAREYLEKARELKDPESFYQLGLLYDQLGKPDSAQMFQKAAVCGWGEGMLKWGECLYLGKGIRKDAQQAIKWFERAYENDIDGAAYYLGRCYAEGKGIIQNIDKAKDLFDEELKKRNSYYKSALEAKTNIQKQAEGEIAKFTNEIKRYPRLSKNDLYSYADRYHIPHSKAESIAKEYTRLIGEPCSDSGEGITQNKDKAKVLVVEKSNESKSDKASEAKANIQKQAEGEIAKFTNEIKRYPRLSKNDLYSYADRYHVPHSKAESIARKYIKLI